MDIPRLVLSQCLSEDGCFRVLKLAIQVWRATLIISAIYLCLVLKRMAEIPRDVLFGVCTLFLVATAVHELEYVMHVAAW